MIIESKCRMAVLLTQEDLGAMAGPSGGNLSLDEVQEWEARLSV